MYNISCFVCLYFFFANVPYEPENLSNYNDDFFLLEIPKGNNNSNKNFVTFSCCYYQANIIMFTLSIYFGGQIIWFIRYLYVVDKS